eukprot:symbB.v1.2.016019.t1/scaffold1206.1/size131539/9
MPKYLFLLVVNVVLSSALKVDEASPAKKVVRMLKKLKSDVTALGLQEKAEFAEYAKFCEKTKDEKSYQIDRSGKKINKWGADIDVLAEDLKALDGELEKLTDEKSDLQKQLSEATSSRDKAKAEYEAGAKEISDAMAALEKARDTIKGAQEELSLAGMQQFANDVLEIGSRTDLRLDSQQLAQLNDLGAPAPKYKAKSSDIVSMLRGLRSTFVANKQNLDMEEEEAKGSFIKLKMNLEHEIKYTGQILDEKILKKSKKDSAKAQLEKDKTAEENAVDTDKTFLASLTEDCEQKATIAAQREKKNEEELTALSAAISKLAEGGVELPQVKVLLKSELKDVRQASFLQIDSEQSHPDGAWAKLKELEAKTNLPALSLAMREASHAEDPLAKVRELIKGMVTKLQDQGKEEATAKSFCDEEVKKHATSRDKYKAEIETLTSKMETDTASLHQSKKESALTTEDISKLSSELDEATKIRANESASNEVALKEAKAGKASADFALKTLKGFYSSGSAFVQSSSIVPDRDGKTLEDLAPKVNAGDYGEDAKQRSSGVLGMLEVLRDEFSSTVTETKDAEEKASAAFDKYKASSKTDLEGKQKLVDSLTSEISDLEASLLKTKGDLGSAKKGLTLSEAELDKLKGLCTEGEESAEVRRVRREEEIQTLKKTVVELNELMQSL